VLFLKLVEMGYRGKTTILYSHLQKRRTELMAYAVMRYETVPGQQAQVDWAECGHVWENGIRKKRYCFVMKLGFSRRSYMEFTTSMQQPILFACMKRAFAYFGGIPLEILFDNMKTAFIFDHQKGQWVAHSKMLAFAAHYGFAPKRCRVRRPHTKGKVEREIRFLKSSFFPTLRLEGIDVATQSGEKLNERIQGWLARVDGKILHQFQQTRLERFELDLRSLKPLPATAYDHRITEPLKVSTEARVTFGTNQYSVDAAYRGKYLDGRYDPDAGIISLYLEGKEIKHIKLFAHGARKEAIEPHDRQSLYDAWEADRKRYEKQMRRRIDAKKQRAQQDNLIAHPAVYDELFGVISGQLQGVGS
jgi:transposase